MAMPGDPSLADRPWLDEQAKPFIEIQGVTKRFGDFVAVDDVSLKIYRGELFALLGGSGCGKTTLLRMLAGFEVPSEGVIKIDDVDKGKNKGSVGRNIPFRELVKAKGKPPGKAEIGKGDESAEPDFLFFM